MKHDGFHHLSDGMLKYCPVLLLLLFSCVNHDLGTDIPEPEVPEPCDPLLVSWENDILPIMTISCSTSGCHDGITRRDWRDYDEVKTYADAIKTRTQNKSMPFDNPLPQEEIDLIACWVDGGAMNN